MSAALERLANETGREVMLHFPTGQRRIRSTMRPLPADHERAALEITRLLKQHLGIE